MEAPHPSRSLSLALATILAALLVYSQTTAFHWDEGFHLVAAWLIASGKRPYIDFLFAQTPLNAYWNAAWFRAFGPSWRIAHALAALETWLAVALVARHALKRFPIPEWRTAAALSAAALFGCLTTVFDFAALGQAYGFCLLLLAAAFRLAVSAWLIKSTYIDDIKSRKGRFEFSGRGWGHGVGMCQWGAKGMGDKGHSYREIIKYYFPQTDVKQRD